MTIQLLVAELENSNIKTPWSEIERRYIEVQRMCNSLRTSALDRSPRFLVATDETVAALLPGIALEIESYLADIAHVENAEVLYETQSRLHLSSRRVYGPLVKNYYAWATIPLHWSFVTELLPGADAPLGFFMLKAVAALRGDRYPILPEWFSSYRGYSVDPNRLPLATSAATDSLDRYGLEPSFDIFIEDPERVVLVASALVKG